jgi:hypothetical protein
MGLALLEEAWLARMQFSEETSSKVTDFFNHNQDDTIYLISNTNEMDCRTIIAYLRKIYPSLCWKSCKTLDLALKVPDQSCIEGISLTEDGQVKLYTSYTHHAFKNGWSDETTITTDRLLQQLIAQEKLDVNSTRLISQWSRDRDMANHLKIKDVIDAKHYFYSDAIKFKLG